MTYQGFDLIHRFALSDALESLSLLLEPLDWPAQLLNECQLVYALLSSRLHVLLNRFYVIGQFDDLGIGSNIISRTYS